MIFYKKLNSTIFFDVETVAQYPDLNVLEKENQRMYKLWKHKSDVLRTKHPTDASMEANKFYQKYAPLFGEYGKVVSIALGLVEINSSMQGNYILKSITSDDESEILEKFKSLIDNHKSNNKYSFLAGHNIKGFDITFLGQRYIVNGIQLPKHLQVQDKKPWEVNHIDSSELWSFGNFQRKYTKLDELACLLDVDSPKGDIDGSLVNEVYWKEQDLDRIDTYCKADVATVIEILFKMCGVELNQDDE